MAAVLLAPYAPVRAGEAPAEGEREIPRLDLEYGKEDLDRDPPIVAGSGRIHVSSGDFELLIPDGGVVLWVEPEEFRRFKSRLGGLGGGGAEKDEAGKDEAGEKEPPSSTDVLGTAILEMYAEGDVTLRRGHEVVRARRLYYNFAENRAVIFDAEIRALLPESRRIPRVPLLLRAERIYQVVADRYEAGPARVTTCRFAEPHYELSVDRIELTSEETDQSLEAHGTTLRAFGVPVMWAPWLLASARGGIEPVKSADFGTSSKFGTHASITLGGSLRTGEERRVWGQWEVKPLYRDRRGPGLGAELLYGDEGYRGEIQGVYQRDRQDFDRVSELGIPRRDRGWARWRHRHLLSRDLVGGRLTALAEIAWISDRGFLTEYDPSEEKQKKAQEWVAYLDWAGAQQALSVTGKWRANEFQTQTEVRPRVAYDLFDLPLATDVLGTDLDLFLSGEAEAAKLVRVYDHDRPDRGVLTDRYQGRAVLAMPFGVGPVRFSPEFGAGVTGYEGGQDGDRLDLFTGIRAGTDLHRVYPDVTSDLFDLRGLRHVIDVSAGWANRFAVTKGSDDLDVQDPADLLDEVEAFDVRVRNRLQTKRGDAVVDWIDLELRALWFPSRLPERPAPFAAREEWELGISSLLVPEEEKFRAVERHGLGPVLGDLRAQLRPDLFLVGDAWFDFDTREWETYSGGLRYEAQPDLSFFLGHRGIEGDSSVLTAWVDKQLTGTWSARVLQQVNLRGGRQVTGLQLRRFFHDFIVELSIRRNERERDTSFGISIEPLMIFEWRRRRHADDALDFEGMRWVR